MSAQIKCMFCGSLTVSQKSNVQKKIDDRMVTLKNAPVFYCPKCKEIFFSNEVMKAFSLIKDRELQEKDVIFDYEQIAKK